MDGCTVGGALWSPGEAEVGYLGLVLGRQQDVPRRQVSVHKPGIFFKKNIVFTEQKFDNLKKWFSLNLLPQ